VFPPPQRLAHDRDWWVASSLVDSDEPSGSWNIPEQL